MLIGFYVTLSEYSGEFVTVNNHLVILSRRRLDSCQIAPLRDSILKLQRLESNFFPKFSETELCLLCHHSFVIVGYAE